MYIPAKNRRKSCHGRYSLIICIAVPISLQHYRRAFDVIFQPPDAFCIFRKICFQKGSCIETFVSRRIPYCSEPCLYTVSKVTAGPNKKSKSHHCDSFKDLFTEHKNHTEDSINHGHAKHDICLICQFEHGIGSCTVFLINITYINQLRDHDQSNGTKPHDHSKKIWN